jgi:hypothetical protein
VKDPTDGAGKSQEKIFKVALPVSLEAVFQTSLGLIDEIIVGTLGATAVAAVGLRKNAISKNAIQHLGRLHARRDDKTQKGEMQNLLTDVRYTNGTRKLLPKRSTLKHRVCFTLSYSIGQNRTPASNPSRRAALACF